MTEIVKNAWTGWLDFTSDGKLAALFLAALIYLWLCGEWEKQKRLFYYTAGITLCCLLPVTAAVLMLYQTRFYDYVWLWSLVPMTAVTAWAAVETISQLWEDSRPAMGKRWIPAVILLLAALALGGGLGESVFNPANEREERQQAGKVLAEVKKQQTGELCLWAPREILAYVRESDSSVRLIYGRNMWDISLGAYTYDTYSDELRDIYLWMEIADETGVAKLQDEKRGKVVLQGADCVTAAMEAGANCILLPSRLESQVVKELAKTAGAEFSQVEGYYLLTR